MKLFLFLTTLFFSFNATAETSQFKLELIFAKRGDVSAQFRVATAYEDGIDAKKDLKQAFEWYMKAATQSHAPSQYKVGVFYENGFGVEKNEKEAIAWYTKAKANGSSRASKRLDKTAFEKDEIARKQSQKIAQEKLEQQERAREDAKLAKEKQLAAQRASAKQVNKQGTTKTPAAKKVIAKEESKKPAPSINIPDLMKVVLNNRWKNQDGAADYLPSAATTCLESAENELTCFSSEKSRKVNGVNVKYTAKSTVLDFKANGSFKVFYHYNGIEIPATGNASDEYGLMLKQGWQEPALAATCQAKDRKNISCTRNGKHVEFRI